MDTLSHTATPVTVGANYPLTINPKTAKYDDTANNYELPDFATAAAATNNPKHA